LSGSCSGLGSRGGCACGRLPLGPVAFKFAYSGLQPDGNNCLGFFRRRPSIQVIDGFPLAVQGDMTAGSFGGSTIRRHELHQGAFRARSLAIEGVEVQTRRRILKNERRPARKRERVLVAPFFQKLQLCFQNMQRIVLIPWHIIRPKQLSSFVGTDAVTRVTDLHI
jgi:hypothetical protein